MDDELLTIREPWPGTTIDGERGLVSGLLTVSRAAGGERVSVDRRFHHFIRVRVRATACAIPLVLERQQDASRRLHEPCRGSVAAP